MTVTLEGVTLAVDGIAAIRDVSLTLERGTLSVLLGPTLSGKTSIMRLLAVSTSRRPAGSWSMARMLPAPTCGSVRWRWFISSSSITPR